MVDNTLEAYLAKWKIRCVMVKAAEKEAKRDELLVEYEQLTFSD